MNDFIYNLISEDVMVDESDRPKSSFNMDEKSVINLYEDKFKSSIDLHEFIDEQFEAEDSNNIFISDQKWIQDLTKLNWTDTIKKPMIWHRIKKKSHKFSYFFCHNHPYKKAGQAFIKDKSNIPIMFCYGEYYNIS